MNRCFGTTACLVLTLLVAAGNEPSLGQKKMLDQQVSQQQLTLNQDVASNFAGLALRCISREYPNKPDHIINDEKDVLSPKSMHPVFYGCFDWHSSVHGHWMLVRLLRTFPDLPEATQIRAALSANLSAQNVKTEVQYLDQPGRKSFERTYGWAWLLKLAEELHGWNDEQGKQWAANLEPLVQVIVAPILISSRAKRIRFAPVCIQTPHLESRLLSTMPVKSRTKIWKRWLFNGAWIISARTGTYHLPGSREVKISSRPLSWKPT